MMRPVMSRWRLRPESAAAPAGGATEIHSFELSGEAAACVLRLRVLNASTSGGHAFQLRQVTLTAPSPTAARTAEGESVPAGGPRGGKQRVARRQRAMIRASYRQ